MGGVPGPSGPWAFTLSETGEAQTPPLDHHRARDHPDGGGLADLALVLVPHDAEAVGGMARVDELDGGGSVGGGDDGTRDLQRVIGLRRLPST